jgi:phage-related protein
LATIHEILLRVAGETQDAETSLNRIARKVVETGTLKAAPEVDLKGATEAFTKLATINAALDELDGKNISAEFRLKIDRARTSLAFIENDLRNVMARITQARRTGSPMNESDLRRAGTLLRQLSGETERVGKMMAEAGGGAGNLNQQFSGMLGAIKQINPILQGLAIVLITALIPAMLALAASLVSAAGGVAVLANAFLASLGPAALLIVAIFQRVAKVIEVLQARKSAMSSQVKKSAQEQLAEAQAAETLRNAHNAVRDAIEARSGAQKRLDEAESQAHRQIVQARGTEVAAVNALRLATQDAFDAMAQSVRDATTALHSYQAAQLGIEQSKLDTKRARLELQKLRADMGLTGKKFDTLFNQLTDVSINPTQLRAAIKSQLAAGTITQDQALQLEQAHLDVRRAVLGEKEATDRLTQSKADLTKARRTEGDFIRNNIRAYAPYVQAVNAARTAERNYRRLLRQGIEQNPQVVAARDALRDANQRVTESQHDLNSTLKLQRLEAEQATGPLAQYHALMKKLTPVEQEFVRTLVGARKGFAAIMQGGTDAFFAGLIISFNTIKPLLAGASGLFTQLGTVWAQNLFLFSKQLVSPQNLVAFRQFGHAAVTLSGILGGRAWRAFFQIMVNLAKVAMPLLIDLANGFASTLEDAASATGDVSKTAPIINTMVESFRVWLHFIGAVFKALGAIVEVAAPFGDEIVGWLTDAVNAFADWAKSAKGKNEIKQFFSDTLPLVKETLTFIGKLGVVFLQALQLVAPVLAGFLHSINDFLSMLSTILGFFDKIVSSPIGQAIRFAIGQFIGFGAIGRIIGGIWKGLKIVGSTLDAVSGTVGRVLGFIVARFRGLFGAVGHAPGVVRSAVGGMIRALTSLPGRIGGIFRSVVGAITNWTAPLRGAARSVAGGILDAFRGIGRRISSFFGGVVGIIKGVLNRVIGVVNFVIRALDKVSVKIPKVSAFGVHIGGGRIGINIPEIPTLAKGGVPTGPLTALIGDANEAVLPLQGAVLKRVAHAIASELTVSLAQLAAASPALAGAGVTHRSATIENLNLITAEGGLPDGRAGVSSIAQEFQRRGI